VIAVLDDDLAFLNLMKVLLTQEGYQTIPWQERRGAVDMIRRERPDLLIMDLRIVSADAGWDLLDELRRYPDTERLPVIVCSGDTVALRRNAATLKEKGCETVEKPFEVEDLLAKVRRCAGPPQEQAGEA
jgi:CheY-like chemotaxis protein